MYNGFGFNGSNGQNSEFQGGQGYNGFGFQGGMAQPGFNQQDGGYQGLPLNVANVVGQQAFGQPQSNFYTQSTYQPQQPGFYQQPTYPPLQPGFPHHQSSFPQPQPQPGYSQPQPGFSQQQYQPQLTHQDSFQQQPIYPQPQLQHQGSLYQQPIYPQPQLQPQVSIQQQPSYLQQYTGQVNSQPGLQNVMPGLSNAMGMNQQVSSGTAQIMIYNPEQDCDVLRKAMRGLGTDEDTIIKIICNRTNLQRQQIKSYYKTAFGKDLIKELKSELSGKFEDVVLGLFDTPSEYDANCLLKAMKGLGTDEDTLIEIIGTRNNAQLKQIRTDFQRLHKTDLIKYVESETSGRFRKLLVSLLQANRNESMIADHDQCTKWARELYQAGEARWGTDEAIFNKIFALRSHAEIKMICSLYEQISKRSLLKAIDSEFSGDIKKLLKTVVQYILNPSEYFAKRVHDSVAGLGTNNKVLIRILISRDEIDMGQIKYCYQQLYGKDMMGAIKSDTSGDYRKILMELAGH